MKDLVYYISKLWKSVENDIFYSMLKTITYDFSDTYKIHSMD